MRTRADIECWLTDMDGVLVHENTPVPGAAALLQQWRDQGTPFLVLTNNSIFTPRDLSARLRSSGLVVPEGAIWTSALATADFLHSQAPGASAFVIGEAGLTTALHEAGFIMTETDPDYVVVGETRNYSFEAITKAIRFIAERNIIGFGLPTTYGCLPVAFSIIAAMAPVAGRTPSADGPVASGFVAMNRAPAPMNRIAFVMASNE